MQHLMICFVLLLVATAIQAQVTPLPRDGEARADRSEYSTFWVNPVILQPSVFFDKQEVQQRSDRKWWRRPAGPPVSTVDYQLPSTGQKWQQESDSNHGDLLYPISFGKNIPPVKPLWEGVSNKR